MSQQARNWLISHPHTVFQRDSQRQDLRDPSVTKTELIALLIELIQKGHIILFTAIKSDHHADNDLGFHTHENGFCADVWPLNSTEATDFVNANESKMTDFLADGARSSWLYQIGLAGTADTVLDRSAAGSTVFSDDGADHIHLGTNSD